MWIFLLAAALADPAAAKPAAAAAPRVTLSTSKGPIAMARTSDPDSATAQWFINLKDNTFLDRAEAQDGWGYTVFGKVVSGMEAVDAIAKVATGTKAGMSDVPTQTVSITSAKHVKH